jgi:hypothetical protein
MPLIVCTESRRRDILTLIEVLLDGILEGEV